MSKKPNYSTDQMAIRMFMSDYNRKAKTCASLATALFLIFPDRSKWTEDIDKLHDDLDNIMPTYELNEDTIDLESAQVFDCGDGRLELQAINKRTCHSCYWWTNPNVSPEEYKENRINVIRKVIQDRSNTWRKAITDLENNLNMIRSIDTLINQYGGDNW